MIKVIKEGAVPRGQITCPNCQSILEYGNADTHDDWQCASSSLCKPQAITCPVCDVEISVSRV